MESAEGKFQAYERPTETVNSFIYLGQVLIVEYNNWLEVVGSLSKARNSWERMTRILGREGANSRVSGVFFKAVVQAVLIFGSETWVLTPCMGQDLGSFQHGVERGITRRQPRKQEEGGWE